MNIPNTFPPAQGWECPKCHSVYAPFMPACLKCGSPVTATSDSTVKINPDGTTEWTTVGGMSFGGTSGGQLLNE